MDYIEYFVNKRIQNSIYVISPVSQASCKTPLHYSFATSTELVHKVIFKVSEKGEVYLSTRTTHYIPSTG